MILEKTRGILGKKRRGNEKCMFAFCQEANDKLRNILESLESMVLLFQKKKSP